MKLTIVVPRPSPGVDPRLLVRFVLRQLSETKEPDSTEPSPVLLALILAAASHDHDFYNRLKEVISSSDSAEKILGMCEDLFMPALGQIGCEQILDDPDMGEENPFPDEQNCEQVLLCALAEGKRILAEKDFEFLRVFEFLTRTGLSCYSFRLYQFDAILQPFQDEPENLVRKGVEIIRAALGSRGNKN
ncbi:MAG: hypothetical protein ACLP5H_23360 [Desulfomonilaceae bacterium]